MRKLNLILAILLYAVSVSAAYIAPEKPIIENEIILEAPRERVFEALQVYLRNTYFWKDSSFNDPDLIEAVVKADSAQFICGIFEVGDKKYNAVPEVSTYQITIKSLTENRTSLKIQIKTFLRRDTQSFECYSNGKFEIQLFKAIPEMISATITAEKLKKEKQQQEVIEREKQEKEEKENLQKIIDARATRLKTISKKEKNGFKDIPFGALYDDVLAELEQQYPPATDSYTGKKVYGEDNYILLTDFPLGDHLVTVIFYFDHEKRFYSFELRTHPVNASELDPGVLQSADYLTMIFKNKYGKPVECFKPNILTIRPGYISFFCKWNNRDLDIYTGVSTADLEYSAEGTVTSKKYKIALEALKKKKTAQEAVKGAKGF